MELRGNKNLPLKLTDNNESPEGRFSGFSGHQIRTSSFYCWRVFNLYFYREARLQLRRLHLMQVDTVTQTNSHWETHLRVTAPDVWVLSLLSRSSAPSSWSHGLNFVISLPPLLLLELKLPLVRLLIFFCVSVPTRWIKPTEDDKKLTSCKRNNKQMNWEQKQL